jgi:hypothetical protein
MKEITLIPHGAGVSLKERTDFGVPSFAFASIGAFALQIIFANFSILYACR